MTTAVPCRTRGRTRFANPYECEKGIAPRFRSPGVRPIVEQMLFESAIKFASEQTIAFGMPVDPEVSLIIRAPAGRGGRSWTARRAMADRRESRSGR